MKIKQFILIAIATLGLLSVSTFSETTKYKCMIQMTNYTGEAAYVIISLINPQGEYEKTLYVQGDDDEWYHDISDWWNFYGKKRTNLDAITGATIAGGARTISVIDIDDSKIDAGYSIRFETAVEDQEYYTKDVEFPLTTENVKSKQDGTGFIRYIRMMPN
ncbi:DUF2271 domain-containing protein [Xanthomarina sp. F1114]|uniref:DUF2271 domain-containing protein n=1 Tax=unclassified Xanthomarina TaxID=2649071 RepID=UPI00225DD5EF|nr:MULTISPECIES: DUF2271 domain-containing protein [unclassified Xanthomarina]MCX7546466.1 DUF2271 domain-containing protein [Xanthomarina sp. F1114]MCX7551173.1 DUF2271 domain-containing protein [Xanthomarina sp. F2636L]